MRSVRGAGAGVAHTCVVLLFRHRSGCAIGRIGAGLGAWWAMTGTGREWGRSLASGGLPLCRWVGGPVRSPACQRRGGSWSPAMRSVQSGECRVLVQGSPPGRPAGHNVMAVQPDGRRGWLERRQRRTARAQVDRPCSGGWGRIAAVQADPYLAPCDGVLRTRGRALGWGHWWTNEGPRRDGSVVPEMKGFQ